MILALSSFWLWPLSILAGVILALIIIIMMNLYDHSEPLLCRLNFHQFERKGSSGYTTVGSPLDLVYFKHCFRCCKGVCVPLVGYQLDVLVKLSEPQEQELCLCILQDEEEDEDDSQ